MFKPHMVSGCRIEQCSSVCNILLNLHVCLLLSLFLALAAHTHIFLLNSLMISCPLVIALPIIEVSSLFHNQSCVSFSADPPFSRTTGSGASSHCHWGQHSYRQDICCCPQHGRTCKFWLCFPVCLKWSFIL